MANVIIIGVQDDVAVKNILAISLLSLQLFSLILLSLSFLFQQHYHFFKIHITSSSILSKAYDHSHSVFHDLTLIIFQFKISIFINFGHPSYFSSTCVLRCVLIPFRCFINFKNTLDYQNKPALKTHMFESKCKRYEACNFNGTVRSARLVFVWPSNATVPGDGAKSRRREYCSQTEHEKRGYLSMWILPSELLRSSECQWARPDLYFTTQ